MPHNALHEVGSNNPDGVEIKKEKDSNGVPVDGIPFHPYYTVHDVFGCPYFPYFAVVVFFAPELGGYFLEYNNFIPADPLVTPNHIALSGTLLRFTQCSGRSLMFSHGLW
ncbi:MAG: hypothetical protein CM15mP58_07710 [Burkholderiaceae bacterium]|nr:MAG: hypothetical protein CM15mP58_07710 [Burkholderiaceae bacterium]